MGTGAVRNDTRKTWTRTERTETTKPKVDPKTKPSTTTTGGGGVTANQDGGSTSPSTRPRPTLDGALAARRGQANDPRIQQLRGRADNALGVNGQNNGANGEGDAPTLRALRNRPQRRTFGLEGEGTTAGTAAQRGNTEIAGKVGGLLGRNGEMGGSTQPEGWRENKDGSYTFHGTGGDDQYTMREDSKGNVIVTNGCGVEYQLDAADADNGVSIAAGSGDDKVTIDGSVNRAVEVRGGTGNDTINARDANGPLTIKGGAGDDSLMGGKGDDDLQGGSGNDYVSGGDGADALEGGRGDDQLFGGKGNDQLHGQEGNDNLYGMDGDDFIQGGDGEDGLYGGKGGDAIYSDKNDRAIDAGRVWDSKTKTWKDDGQLDLIVGEQGGPQARGLGATDRQLEYDPEATEEWLKDHPELVIDGDPDFVARTTADIGVMLSTEEGRGLLGELSTALNDKGETLTIKEKEGEPGGTYSRDSNTVTVGEWAAKYSDGTNRMPLPAFYHELSHAYQDLVSGYPEGASTFEGGATASNTERQATGLPWIDENGVLHGPDDLKYSDNVFRRALGLPERTTYSGEPGDPNGYTPDNDEGHDH